MKVRAVDNSWYVRVSFVDGHDLYFDSIPPRMIFGGDWLSLTEKVDTKIKEHKWPNANIREVTFNRDSETIHSVRTAP